MGKPDKNKRASSAPRCPICGEAVRDHQNYVQLVVTKHGQQNKARGHSGCVGAVKAYEKLRGA